MNRSLALYHVLTLLTLLCPLRNITNAQEPKSPEAKPKSSVMQPDPAWKPLGKSLWFDPKVKRLILRTKVVLRDGALEHFLCLKGTKEHEAILATDAPPRQIHAGLLLTGAEPGHPVRFTPKFEPPAGTALALELEWKKGDQILKSDARRWVKDLKTKDSLAEHWVFAGSDLYQDPVSKKIIYAADEGDLITVANFGTAILDLPFASSADNADRMFMANTDKIPEIGTEVYLSLRPLETVKADSGRPRK